MFHHSFLEYCTSADNKLSDKPVVCILGLSRHKEISSLFKRKMAELESTAYDSFSRQLGNFNDKVHRFQFGYVDLEKNKRVRQLLVDPSGVKNPKLIVYVSELNMVGVFNNLNELDNLVEDFSYGEWEELKSLRDIIDVKEFADLLVNEHMSVLLFVYYTVKHSITWSLLLFAGVYFLMRKRIQSQWRVVGLAASLPLLMIVVEVVTKMIAEELI